MNPEIKKQWIDALRSGRYKQGKNKLRKDDSFCCLGVLCDLHSAQDTACKWSNGFYDGNCTYPPSNVLNWAELNAECDVPVGTTTLVRENDKGTPFDKIADLIEEHL